jgi:hypothetical protein
MFFFGGRIRDYCTIVCAVTRAFQRALVPPLGMKLTEIIMTSGLTTATATSALSRETATCTKETPETPGTHVKERLKRLCVRIGETMKRLRSTSVVRWWLVHVLVWVHGGRQWVLGSINPREFSTFENLVN